MVIKTHPHPIITEHKPLADKLTSINTYADADTWKCLLYATKHFRFTATDDDLDVKILGSVDGGVTFPIEVVAEFSLVPATDLSKTVTVYFTHLKVQVKPTVNDAHGTLSTQVAGASF